MIATFLDESMGILMQLNHELAHMREVALGKKDGEWADMLPQFTVELVVKYKSQVKTPGLVMTKAELVKKEGRKTWVRAMLYQKSGKGEGDMVLCSVAEGLFVEPRTGKM